MRYEKRLLVVADTDFKSPCYLDRKHQVDDVPTSNLQGRLPSLAFLPCVFLVGGPLLVLLIGLWCGPEGSTTQKHEKQPQITRNEDPVRSGSCKGWAVWETEKRVV